MPVLVWDKVGDRVFESGLDRGVLYLPDGSAVPWNGLTSVVEKSDMKSTPVYYDGMKINDLVVLGDFSASMKAVTYPEEFAELEGRGFKRKGLFFGDQPPQTFALCYRTQIGNDLEGQSAGYKIHILYNVTAIPREKTHATLSGSPSLEEFEWEITAVPEEVPGFRPTAHMEINSLDLDPWLLEEIEEMLYGSTEVDAMLLPMSTLIAYIDDWFRVKIIDNEDGTWTAITNRDELLNFLTDDLFQLLQVNAVYLNETTVQISDTIDVSEVPQIRIDDNGDGTWTAITDHEDLIEVFIDGSFEIRNANATYLGPESYRISDTTDED